MLYSIGTHGDADVRARGFVLHPSSVPLPSKTMQSAFGTMPKGIGWAHREAISANQILDIWQPSNLANPGTGRKNNKPSFPPRPQGNGFAIFWKDVLSLKLCECCFLPSHRNNCQIANRALTNLERPTILQTGVFKVVGTCSVCQTRASGMINALPCENLPETSLGRTVAALPATGLRKYFRYAPAACDTRQGTDMLRVYDPGLGPLSLGASVEPEPQSHMRTISAGQEVRESVNGQICYLLMAYFRASPYGAKRRFGVCRAKTVHSAIAIGTVLCTLNCTKWT